MPKSLPMLLLVVLAGCDTLFGSSPAVPEIEVTTDRAVYGSGEKVMFTVTNSGREPVYIPKCGAQIAHAIQKDIAQQWTDRYFPFTCHGTYVMSRLEPGGSLQSDAQTLGETGRFRIRVSGFVKPESNSRHDVGYSNDFRWE